MNKNCVLTMWKSSDHQLEEVNICEKLLPKLESRTILVIDNVPYHNV